MTRRISIALALACLLLLGGCEWISSLTGEKKVPLPGERISIMLNERELTPDPEIAGMRVLLPPPRENKSWPEAAGFPDHAMHHLKIPTSVSRAWQVDIGSGGSKYRRLLTRPIAADGRVYTMDVDFQISAFDAASGDRIWRFEPEVPDEDSEAFGGGLAYADGRLFVSTAFGQFIALNAKDGTKLWQQKMPGPMRAAPTVAGGRVFVVSIDNQLTVLNAETGEKLWSHTGFSEPAGLLGGASPAVEGDIVVVPYSSGEIFALRVENGRVVWSDNLTAVRRVDALSSLADIRGGPVIDRGLVIAVSHSGRLVAIDLRTGVRVWERPVSGVETPWVAGDFIYLLSTEDELYCLTRRGGRVRWVRPLPRFVDPKDKDEPIKWSGPVLASDRLVVTGSHGEALSISPYTGEVLSRLPLPDKVMLPPIVADGTLYVLTDDAELLAFR